MADYAWIIDTDHNPTPGALPGTNSNAAGLTGPRGADAALLTELAEGKGRAFRMKGDDDDIAYEGRIVLGADVEEGTETDFAPLDDFGEPNCGCAWIEYRDATGAWAVL